MTGKKEEAGRIIKTVLFDFDGTVYNTVEGITKSIRYALLKHGMEEDLQSLRRFVGPPLADKFMEEYGLSREAAEQMVREFRERYGPVGIFESEPFPGIGELLKALKEAGLRTGVATSKPQHMAEQLIAHAGLSDCFDAVAGSLPGIDKKREMIARAMELLGAEKETTVLVGDTKYDVAGAAECGIPCIGVTWGYAAEGELEAAHPAAIVNSMEELLALLKKGL